MPKVNIYLPDDLADAVKDAALPVSAICQRALEQAVRRVTVIREVASSVPGCDELASTRVLDFTRRAAAVLESAHSSASDSPGAQVRTEHLLDALVAADNMAVRVLRALEITPRQVDAELHRRVTADTPAAPPADLGRPWLSPEAAKAIELAGNESSGLGNSYVGCEHLLLGLIAEPAGIGGSVLRSLGADLRVVRRTVAAALAGWAAARQADPVSPPEEQLAAVLKAELAPVLARIERLESITGS